MKNKKIPHCWNNSKSQIKIVAHIYMTDYFKYKNIKLLIAHISNVYLSTRTFSS